jgi:hypothetical protein
MCSNYLATIHVASTYEDSQVYANKILDDINNGITMIGFDTPKH